MWLQQADSHWFCVPRVFFFLIDASVCLCVCAFLGVLSVGRDKSEIEGGEVRGDAHPLNPLLLTGERSNGAGRSTAN